MVGQEEEMRVKENKEVVIFLEIKPLSSKENIYPYFRLGRNF
jgi:hypothetical protein